MSPAPRLVVLGFLVVPPLVSSGCVSDAGVTDSPPATHSAGLLPIDPQPTPAGPSLDDLFLEVSSEAPGFAGLTVSEDGKATLRISDPTQDALVRLAAARVFGEHVGARYTATLLVKHSFRQLYSWRDALYSAGLPDGVRWVDLDEERNAVRVGTADAQTFATIHELQVRLGIPRDALIVEVAPPRLPTVEYLNSPLRPVLGGLGIVTTARGCTLGFKAKKTGLTRYIATNAHCTNSFGVVTGDEVGQPLLQSNYWVGYESDDPPFVATNCPGGFACRWADVALFVCDTAIQCSNYTVARTTFEYIGSDWSQSGSVILAQEPWYVVGELGSSGLIQGARLSKVGVTSGWTGGRVTATCYDVIVGPNRLLRCQYDLSAVSRPGDSGSPVFSYDTNTGRAWLAGILWGTDGATASVFSPLSGLKADLGPLTVSSPLF